MGTTKVVRRKTMPPGLATGKVTYRHLARRESLHDATPQPGMGPMWLEGNTLDPGSDAFLRWTAGFIRNMFR